MAATVALERNNTFLKLINAYTEGIEKNTPSIQRCKSVELLSTDCRRDMERTQTKHKIAFNCVGLYLKGSDFVFLNPFSLTKAPK